MHFLDDSIGGEERRMIQLALDRNVTKLLNCKLLYGVNTCFKFYIEVFINIVNYD